MSETKWRMKKESFTNKTEIIPEDVFDTDDDDDDDDILEKIEQSKQKSKGFSKLPVLDNIYESMEGFSSRKKKKKSNNNTKKGPFSGAMNKASKKAASKSSKAPGKDKRSADKKAKLKELMSSSAVFGGKEFNTARQIRDFVVKYAKYADIFYDVEVIMLKINDYIVSAHKLEKSKSALWYYQSMNRSRFKFDKSVKILTDSEIDIALEAEYEVLSTAKKQQYVDLANKHKARYENSVKTVKADADLIVSAIRGFSMTLICILISYNIIYTWIHCEGKGFGNLIKTMNENLPSFLTFIAKPAFEVLTFIENTMNMPKVAIDFMDPVKLYLGMFIIVTYTGLFQNIAQSASKLMVDSLTAILKGQFSKSPMIYIFITIVWAVYFGKKIIENPGFIAGVVPVLLIGLLYLLTVILSSLFLAPYFGFAISGYVVYRFIFMIPLATAVFGMFRAFNDIDVQSNPNPDTNTNCSFECIKHYVQTLQFYIKNLFTIMFSVLTMKTIILFAVKLSNKNLRIALPTIMSFLLLIGFKKKYDSRCNPPPATAAGPSAAAAPAAAPAPATATAYVGVPYVEDPEIVVPPAAAPVTAYVGVPYVEDPEIVVPPASEPVKVVVNPSNAAP
jgi:hypothetical protein